MNIDDSIGDVAQPQFGRHNFDGISQRSRPAFGMIVARTR